MREQVPEGVGGRIRRVPVHARSRVVVREQEKPEAEGLALAGRQPPARRRGQREREGGGRVGEGISGAFCLGAIQGVLWEGAGFFGFFYCRQQL